MRPTGVSGPGEAATLRSELAGSLANVALVLASLLAVLLLGETALRLVHPKYEHLAQATWVRAAEGFMRDPGHRRSRRHPDTGEQHEILLNSLGLRQHRDFTAAALQSAVNIGVFGDSFVDNMNMAAEFSFSEPLDYLLNVEREGPATGGSARPSFNVLNFGHGGWGTAESMLRYEQSGLRGRVDHVYYFYTANDVVENVTWALAKGEGYRRPWRFRLDDGGQLERVEAGFGRAFASALLSKLHLSYLALDATSVFSARLGWLYSDPPPGALPVFRQLLRRFKDGVEADGASFRLVWLPHREQPDDVAAIVAEEGVASVSLMDCFAEHDPAHLRTPWGRSPYRFKNDPHRNEAGNRLAAMCLNGFLERQLGLPALSDEAVESALGRYYAAFEAPPAAGRPADLAAAAIRMRYAPLLDAPAKTVQMPHTGQAGQLVIRSTFNVYLHDGWLSYVKPGCDRADFDPIFFLHVVPTDGEELPPDRLAHGFDNLDFGWNADASCTVWTRLPGYPMERIRTGQYLGDGDGVHEVLWEGEHVLGRGRP